MIARHPYTITEKRNEARACVTLTLAPKSSAIPLHEAGQHVFIDPPADTAPNITGRPYSISSLPDDWPSVSITVRKIGVFSTYLHERSIGDTLLVRGPLGNFTVRNPKQPMVFIAGGIGIVPFYPMITKVLDGNTNTPITLIRSDAHAESAAFTDVFDAIDKRYTAFRLFQTYTQNPSRKNKTTLIGRITPAMLEKIISDKRAHWYVCGSVSFVDDMSRALESIGVPGDTVFAELFY